jgi:hypothetical protein
MGRADSTWIRRFRRTFPLGHGHSKTYTHVQVVPTRKVPSQATLPRERAPVHLHCQTKEGVVKQAEDASFIDLIACERDCRTCSYGAALDCDGNCGVCPHNGYCPCVNPVVARSKTALRLIELRPILLQDVRGRS